MKYRFIAAIHFLKIDQPECRIPVKSGIVTNKSGIINDVLSYRSSLAVGTLGIHSIDEFQGNSYYLVDGEFDPNLTEDDINCHGSQVSFAFLRQIQSLTDELWNIRDNSVYVRDGFLFVYDKQLEDGNTFKASLSTINTMASLKIEDVLFSKSEILTASDKMVEISLSEIFDEGANYALSTQFQFFKSSGLDRKSCAGMYVFFARSSAALSVKILMYVTAMEALVSTSTAELSHQVSERVSVLLANSAEDRLSVYNNIKKAYGYRSKAAHGELLKGTETELVSLLLLLDEYMRQLMKFEEPYSFGANELNQFFLNKLLGDK